MGTTIRDYLEKVRFVKDNLWNETHSILKEKQQQIVELNRVQISKHIGSDGQELINKDSRYTGYYQPATQLFADRNSPYPSKTLKSVGGAYNFTWSGAFMDTFRIIIEPDGKSFVIFADGENNPSRPLKKRFFDGYDNLYGLTPKHEEIVNYDIIYPELLVFINKYL